MSSVLSTTQPEFAIKWRLKKKKKEIIRILTLIHSDNLKSSSVSQYYFSVLGKDKVDVAPTAFVTEVEL